MWGFILSFFKYLFDILVFDTDTVNVSPILTDTVWRIFLRGLGQILLALFAIILTFLFGCLSFVWVNLRALCRLTYDTIIFYTIIYPLAKVPYEDSFTVRMVSGPTLSFEYYYKISPEIVRLLVTSELLKKEMNFYVNWEKSRINEFVEMYKKFTKDVGLINNNDVSTTLAVISDKLRANLQAKVDHYWKSVILCHNVSNVSVGKCKMTQNDIDTVNANLPLLCKQFFENRIFANLSEQQQLEEWDRMHAAINDWNEVANFYMTKIFGESILVPIEETDIREKGFRIEIIHLEAKQYFKEMWKGNIRDDLDAIRAVRNNDRRLKTQYEKISSQVCEKLSSVVTPLNWLSGSLYESYLFLKEAQVANYFSEKEKPSEPLIMYQ